VSGLAATTAASGNLLASLIARAASAPTTYPIVGGELHYAPSCSEEGLARLIAMRARLDAAPVGRLRTFVEDRWSRMEVAGLKFLDARDRAIDDARRAVAAGRPPRKSHPLIAARARETRAWLDLCAWTERLS
jgi:hypothetical protein